MTTPFNVSQNIEENLVLHSNFNLPGSQTIQQQGMTKPRRRRRRNGKGGETQLQLQLLGQKKRKLTAEQATLLEMSFGNEQKLDTERKNKLAGELGLHPRQVAVWFQNRRARYKNKQLEEEYTSLKKAHDSAVLQKCALESEVSRLTEKLEETESEKQRMIQQQLAEMEKEIRKLTEGCGENSHNSPSPQLITIQTVGTATAAAADAHDVVKDTPFLDEHYTPQPQPPYQRHQPEPNPSLVLEEQPHQYGSDVTDDGGGGDGDGIGIAYWTGIYQGFMMDNGSLWNDQYFHRL